MSDDRSGHRTGHWTLSPVRVSAQNAAVYRKPAQTLPQCAPANEILFRRRGHVRSEVTLASGQTKICALKYQLEGYIFLVLLLFIKDFKCFLMKEYIHKSTKEILNERPFFKLLYTVY